MVMIGKPREMTWVNVKAGTSIRVFSQIRDIGGIIMKRFSTFSILFVLVIFLLISAYSGSAEAAQKDWPKGLTIGTAPMGSSYFIILTGWGKLITKHVGVQNAIESTGGPAANIVLIEKGGAELGAATNLVLYQGWNGKDWAKGVQYRKVRAIAPLYPGVFHIYALKSSGIKSIYDLNGKRVCVGASGTTPGILGPMIWDILNIKPAKKVNLGWTDANSALRDGLIDAVQGLMGLPFPCVLELQATHEVTICSIPKNDIPKLREKLPLLGETTVPANTYKGQTEAVPTIDVWGYLLASKDLPDDLVYDIVKATENNIDELIAIHKSARFIKQVNAITNSVVPIHSGAIKYYKEIGIDIPNKLIPPEYK
jgi:TRAP transporter TAXI family solute receptor